MYQTPNSVLAGRFRQFRSSGGFGSVTSNYRTLRLPLPETLVQECWFWATPRIK